MTLQAALPPMETWLVLNFCHSPPLTLIAQGLSQELRHFPRFLALAFCSELQLPFVKDIAELRPSLDGQREVSGGVPKSPHVQGAGGVGGRRGC